MIEGPRISIVGAKKSSTAELRLQFDNIEVLLKEGYNHKQICEQLNMQGLEISYSYYRVIMTRLRAAKRLGKGVAMKAVILPRTANVPAPGPTGSLDLIGNVATHDKRQQVTELVHDTQREVTWEKG